MPIVIDAPFDSSLSFAWADRITCGGGLRHERRWPLSLVGVECVMKGGDHRHLWGWNAPSVVVDVICGGGKCPVR